LTLPTGRGYRPGMRAFVGREAELAELRARLEATLAGSGAAVLLAGEPGIGKTRLALELAREAESRGVGVLRATSFEGAGSPPYWPWVQVLRRAQQLESTGRDGERAFELRDLLLDLPGDEGVEPEIARFRLCDAMADVLRAHWTRRPLLLILEDLQWADESSLLVLRLLLRDVRLTRMLVLGTYRDVEARATDGTSVLATLAADARTIQLRGLDVPAVAQLVAHYAQREASDAVARAVHTATGGNPLFVDELVHSLLAEGCLDDAAASSRLPLPQRVRAVIRRRLDHLPGACRRVLTVAAVVGREFDRPLLARLCGIASKALLATIGEACAVGMVVETGGRLAFAHDVFREVLYDDLGLEQRRRLHGEVAAALEALHAADVELHLGELAHHFLHADPGDARAVDYAVRAAERAARQLGFGEAVRWCELGLQGLIAAGSTDGRRRCNLLLALGANRWKAGQIDRAREAYEEAAVLADGLGLPDALARAALGYGGQDLSYDRANEEPRLVQLLERALAVTPPDDGPLRASLLARLAAALAFSAERERGEALAGEAVRMARRVDDTPTLHFVLCCALCATWGPDNLAARLAESAEIVRLSLALGSAGTNEINVSRIAHLEEAGDPAGAELEAESYRRRMRVRGGGVTTWILEVRRAMTALTQGRLGEVEALALRALRVGQEAGNHNAAQYFGAQLIALRREQGRLVEVVDGIGGFAAENPALPVWGAALAWVLGELDREDDARRELDRLAAADFADIPRDMYWLACQWLLAEVVARLGDRRRAERLYADLLPYRDRCATVPMTFNGGSVERALGLLAGVLDRYDEAAAHFEAAIMVNRRIGARPWVAHAEHEYARLRLARGSAADRAHAAELLGRAVESARALGMAALVGRAGLLLASIQASAEGKDEAVFRHEGEYWTIGCDGSTARVRDARGLQLIMLLLSSPGRDIPAARLAVWPEPPSRGADGLGLAGDLRIGPRHLADDGADLDARARAEYRVRLDALLDEAEEAERFNDVLRASRARDEIAALAEQLGESIALHARQRNLDLERARLAVTKAIRYAIRKVERAHPAFGRLLSAGVKTGTSCRWEPDPRRPLRWTF